MTGPAPRLSLLDLPTEILANIAEIVARQVSAYLHRVPDYMPNDPIPSQTFGRNAALAADRRYEQTLSSLRTTCQQFRVLCDRFQFEEITVRQSKREELGSILLHHHSLVKSICIQTDVNGKIVNGVPEKDLPKLTKGDVSTLLSLLPSLPNLDSFCVADEDGWKLLREIMDDTNHSPQSTSHSPLLLLGLDILRRKVTCLDSLSTIPDSANSCLELFSKVRYFGCQSLVREQLRIVATWADLTHLVFDCSPEDPEMVGAELIWAGSLRRLSILIKDDTMDAVAWPILLQASRTLEDIRICLRNPPEDRPLINTLSPGTSFPRLKLLAMNGLTTHVKSLLPHFSKSMVTHLILEGDDELNEDADDALITLIQPLLPTLLQVEFRRLDCPFERPNYLTPSLIDLCDRHNVHVSHKFTFSDHPAYFDVFDASDFEEAELNDVMIVREKEIVQGIEEMIEYQRDWLARCQRIGDIAGLNELNRLMQHTAARLLADRD